MNTQAPWWAGILMALLQVARVRYPELAPYLEAVMIGLASHWGVSLLGQANAQRAEANEQRDQVNRELAIGLRGGSGGTGGAGGSGGGAGGTGGSGGERGTGGRFGGT
jgi:uncharacterized membrane protein YgcG